MLRELVTRERGLQQKNSGKDLEHLRRYEVYVILEEITGRAQAWRQERTVHQRSREQGIRRTVMLDDLETHFSNCLLDEGGYRPSQGLEA